MSNVAGALSSAVLDSGGLFSASIDGDCDGMAIQDINKGDTVREESLGHSERARAEQMVMDTVHEGRTKEGA